MYLVSLHFLCAAHTLSLPITNNFFKFVYSEIIVESAWWVLFRPPWCCLLLWQLKVIRIGLTSISRTFLPRAGRSCTLLFCLYLVSCTQKMHWREHSLADTVPVFSTILQFSSEVSENWGTGLPCLWPSWIYCTGQQNKASLFPCLFTCLSSLCLQLLHHGSYLSFTQVFCPCTLAPLHHLFLQNTDCPFFQALAFPF